MLLRLLSLLQSRRDWNGPEVADRLNVTTRTIRNDVDQLRSLGYKIHATSGVAGDYPWARPDDPLTPHHPDAGPSLLL